MVAETLRRTVRATDSVGRWGGEELVVLLAPIKPEDVVVVADKLRAMVQNSLLPINDSMKRVGVAMAHRDDSLDSIVKRADQAMYLSKTGGRNRVTLAP